MKIRPMLLAMTMALVCATYTMAIDFAMPQKKVETAAKSDSALPMLKLEVDIDNTPGWVALVKGGYQWNLFRHVGYTVSSNGTAHTKTHGRTKSGATGGLGLGYNFGEKLPLTIGLGLGIEPEANFNTRSVFNNGVNNVSVHARQKVSLYNLDLAIDYDFKTCGRWTPFVGVIGGVDFTTNQARITMEDGVNTYKGRFNKTKRINVIGGATIGTKWQLNDCVTLSLAGSYEYLGSIRANNFSFDSGTVAARTSKIRAHQIDVKAGLKINF